jgi:hypothetical protein
MTPHYENVSKMSVFLCRRKSKHAFFLMTFEKILVFVSLQSKVLETFLPRIVFLKIENEKSIANVFLLSKGG